MSTPLPEVIVAGVCGLLFVFLLIKGVCEAAKEADLEAEQQARHVAERVDPELIARYRTTRDLDRGAVDERKARSALYGRGAPLGAPRFPPRSINRPRDVSAPEATTGR